MTIMLRWKYRLLIGIFFVEMKTRLVSEWRNILDVSSRRRERNYKLVELWMWYPFCRSVPKELSRKSAWRIVGNGRNSQRPYKRTRTIRECCISGIPPRSAASREWCQDRCLVSDLQNGAPLFAIIFKNTNSLMYNNGLWPRFSIIACILILQKS